jgi:hypothetical protein
MEAAGLITRPITDDPIGDTPARKAKRDIGERRSRVADTIHAEPDIAGHTINHRNHDREAIVHGDETGYRSHQRRREAMCPECWAWRESFYSVRTRKRRGANRRRIDGDTAVASLGDRKPDSGTHTTPKPAQEHTA